MRSVFVSDKAADATCRANHTPPLTTEIVDSGVLSPLVELPPVQGTAIIVHLGRLHRYRLRAALPLLALVSLLPARAQLGASVTPIQTGKNDARAADNRPALLLTTDLIFPHLAFGGGWETSMTLANLSAASVKVKQYFYDQSGAPMSVTRRTIPDGAEGVASVFEFTLAPNATINFLLPDSSQQVNIGWSYISYDSTNSRIGGYAIFRQKSPGRPDFEALVPLSSFVDSTFVMPFDNLDGFVTSMALLNPASNADTNVGAIVFDHNAVQLETSVINLAPTTQTAFAIPDRFPSTRNRIGTIRFSGSTNRLSTLGFRFNPGGAFATIPMLSWSGMYSTQQPNPVSPFRDYEITVKPTFAIDGNQTSPRIVSGFPLAGMAEVNTTGVAFNPNSKITLLVYFDQPSYTANSVTYKAWQGQYTNLNPGTSGSGSILTGTLTLNATSPSVGATVTGNLQFTTASRSFNVNFTTTITSSQRIQ